MIRRGAVALLLLGWATVAGASEVKLFRLQSQQAFLRGQLEGMSVDALGTLRLAPRAERLTALEEPFVLAAAPHPEGWVIGTGNGGKVLLVTRQGEVRELFATAEPEVFAVWADADGTVFAGSSPDGKVYRHRSGETEVWFEPAQTYVWQLVGTADGALLAATGTQGKLFRITAKGKADVLWDSDDTHVRSLALLADGGVLAGTAGEGRIVRLPPSGKPQTLHDAVHPEVVALAVAADGTAWAAVVASEASQVQLAAPAKPAKQGDKADDDDDASDDAKDGAGETVVVTAEATTEQPIGTRPPGFEGARSEILRIAPSGSTEIVARLPDDTVHSLRWSGDRLWIGTGEEGKLYTFSRGDLVLANDVEERQIMALLPGPGGADTPAFATTNASAFYRLSEDDQRQGTYTSAVLDAKQIARFGSFRWLGTAPEGSQVAFAFRSGIAAEPDATWSPWTAPREGQEIPLAELPAGRYLQWRVTAKAGGGASPALAGAEVSYVQENLAPRIAELTALDPGQILVAFNFNPANQVFEPVHPNREGIFTTLTQAADAPDDQRLKPLWKMGYRTLRWKADDPNQDKLTYELSFRPEEAEAWLPMAKDLADTHYSFDETALPDGVYRFKLAASDGAPDEPHRGLGDERISEPVIVDHTAPRLVRVRRDGDRLLVELEDAGNPLRAADYSVGAAAWKPATAADGLLDGKSETLVVPAAPGARLVILRVTDAAFNTVTFDLAQEAP